MKPGADYDPHRAFLRVWSDNDWAGNVKDWESQSSLKSEVDGCPLYSASRKQKPRAHSSGEADYYAAASATSEAMLIRELEVRTEVRTELLLDRAAARGMCRRERVGIVRQLSTKVVWLLQLVKRGVFTVGACTSAEVRADLGTKSLPVHRLGQLRKWNGLVLDRNENLANGEKEDLPDENEQQGAAVQTISDPRQGDGGVLDTLGFPVRPIRGTKWVSGQMPGAMRQVADTLTEDSWSRAQRDTEKWLERGHTSLLCTVVGKRSPFAVLAKKKWL